MASLGETAVKVSAAPLACAPGGKPSSTNVKRRVPGASPGAAGASSGSGNAQSGVRALGEQINRLALRRGDLNDDTLGRLARDAVQRTDRKVAARAEWDAAWHAGLGCGERRVLAAGLGGEREVERGFGRDAQRAANGVSDFRVQRGWFRGVLRHDTHRQDDVAM